MNVNKRSGEKRIRRTPEEARALILEVAASRLSAHGIEGLNISGVARDAGMSHGTVIHHFGSTGAMRQALLAHMTRDLLADVMSALDHDEPPARVLTRLFDQLSRDGHGRLLAWLALDQQALAAPGGSSDMFKDVIRRVAERSGDESDARQLVYLVAMAALGMGICGDSIAGLIGVTGAERQAFPAWLAALLRSTTDGG